ncbi:hypothetical protein QBC38DRAFT_528435 [Podospora fimiseda]|uniref:Uncharacterized protein n=1 Tax=Podospora fimiseda TaxID=252190 RepID=A0AAN7BXS2_9PEZI|nr:hypothetical protein QBC38DRAFT_528435 [Podospora fimiseda]
MRLSIVTAVLPLFSPAYAGIEIPPPPPGSACLSYPDTYPKPKHPERRGLGITNLPRQWARHLITYMGEKTKRQGLYDDTIACACVTPEQKRPYGFYSRNLCPVSHGAYEACSVEFDGFRCVFPRSSLAKTAEYFTDEKCDAEFPGTRALCGIAYPTGPI